MSRRWSWRLIAAATLAASVAACGDGGDVVSSAVVTSARSQTTQGTADEPAFADAPSVDELYGLVERSLAAGGVYHQTAAYVEEIGDNRSERSVEIWVDGPRDAVRLESSTHDQNASAIELTIDGITYVPGRRLEPQTCRGAGSAATVLLGCGETMHVETATHEGHPALVLVRASEVEGGDGMSRSTTRLVVDPTTGLPWAASTSGEYDTGTPTPIPMSTEVRYDGEFLDSVAVPPHMFDLASLGFPTDPAAELPTDVNVHWLGPQFDPGNGLPPLVFAQVERGTDMGPGYAAILFYSAAVTASAQPFVLIQVWPRTEFEQSGMQDALCPRGPLDVDVGGATFQCADHDAGSVLVETTDSVLWLTAPLTHSADGELPNPYRDEDAMTLVVEALRLRVV